MSVRTKGGFSRWLRYHYLRLVRLNDTPEKIAGGLALGVVLGILPTFGLGVVIALLVAGIFRVNKVSAIAGTLVMNPWTATFFWAASYMVGSLVMGNNIAETVGLIKTLKTHTDLWKSLLTSKLLVPYIVGDLIVSASAAATFYIGGLYAVRAYRHAKKARAQKKRKGVRGNGIFPPDNSSEY
jgi:hypothetical protein